MMSSSHDLPGSTAADYTSAEASSTEPQREKSKSPADRSAAARRDKPGAPSRLRVAFSNYLEQFCSYAASNIWSLVPAAAALLLVVLAGQFMAVSHDDCSGSETIDARGRALIPRVNPVICPGTPVLRGIFGVVGGSKEKPRYLFPIPVESAGLIGRREAETVRKKGLNDADAEFIEAERVYQVYLLSELKTNSGAAQEKSKQGADLSKKLKQARSKLGDERMKFNAATEAVTTIVLLREARARTLWFVSYGLSLAVVLGTIVAMVWVIGTAFGDQWLPSGLAEPRRERRVALVLLMAVSMVVLLGIAWVGYWAIHWLVFAGFNVPPPFDAISHLLRVNDSLRSSLFDSETGRTSSMVDALNGAVIVAVSCIAVAATVLLYQHPEQEESRKTGNPTQSFDGYAEFLARCFRRLSVAIYFGAVLLVACVIRIGAEYGWLSALLDPAVTEEPAKTSLPGALTSLADLLTFTYGLVFTLILTGLFLPAWIILRRRAWQVVRTKRPAGAETLRDQEQWLEKQGLSFTSFQYLVQILALLAPLGAGTFIAALKGSIGT